MIKKKDLEISFFLEDIIKKGLKSLINKCYKLLVFLFSFKILFKKENWYVFEYCWCLKRLDMIDFNLRKWFFN